MDMLEQTNPLQSSLIDTNATPLSVSAPRAAAVARAGGARRAARVSDGAAVGASASKSA